jgi:hypothetical protein
MDTGRKKKCWERNLSQCNVICHNYHIDCPGLEATFKCWRQGKSQSASIEPFCQHGIFKAGVGVITTSKHGRPKCCEGRDS